MYLIVGLGNPGKEYNLTRHNIGFDVVTKFAEDINIDINKKDFKGIYGKGKLGREDLIILMPQTFMNLSGNSVYEAVNYFKIPLENIIVVYDDITLEVGKIKLKKDGSAGGHNGLSNIIDILKTQNIKRIKYGIGQKPKEMKLADYVLGKFDKSLYEDIKEGIIKSSEALKYIIENDFDRAMNKYNVKGEK